MQLILLLICIVFVLGEQNLSKNLYDDFNKFAVEFERAYASQPDSPEFVYRFHIFQNNARFVDQLNRESKNLTTFSLVGNPFADLSSDEFRSHILMRSRSPVADWNPSTISLESSLPGQFDWRDKGAVTSVKDQGSLGTCWAFSAIQNLEGQLFLKKGTLMDLSVEQLVECDNTDDPEKSEADCSMFGGWPFLAFQYLKRAGGVRPASLFPYCSGWNNKSQCYPCMPSGYSKKDCGNHDDLYCNKSGTLGQGSHGFCNSTEGIVASVSSWDSISTNETKIAASLVSIGPLSVAMNAARLTYYKKGIYNPKFCDPTDLDHAVLLVGYGEDAGTDYWIVKNSWGPKWGENGYFRIIRGVGKCGINTQVSTGEIA